MPRGQARSLLKEESSDLSPPPVDFSPDEGNSSKLNKSRKRKRVSASLPISPPKGKNTVPTNGAVDDTTVQPTKKTRTPSKVETETIEVKSRAIKAEVRNGDRLAVTETTTTKRRRKTKEEKEAESMPLAARTVGHAYNIGAHVSSAGGVHNAVTNAVHIGANAFALFLKSQRKWANPPLVDDVASSWHQGCAHHGFAAAKHVVPHGSYLVNLAHTDPERTKQAYDAFLDDLRRCERLGIGLYNFHPGNVQGVSRAAAISHLAANLNRAHSETKGVVTLLENMAAGGNVLGSTFEDLAQIIEQVDDKDRVGVCLDTCHAFAAGYDLRDKESLEDSLAALDKTVGLKYLRALHLNDSKAPFRSYRDLHANIGTGFLGLRAFHAIMNEPRLHGLPMVLETPIDVYDSDGNPVKDEKGKDNKEDKSIWSGEIKLLEGLQGMDPECDKFKELETSLAAKGRKERDRVQDQVDRRDEKAKAKAKANKSSKGRKKQTAVGTEESDSIDD